MTTSAGSGKDDSSSFDSVEAGVVGVCDVSRPGSAETRMYSISENRVMDASGGHSAADRRRSFAAMSPSRLSISPPTIEDIDVENFDDDDDDEEKEEETNNMSELVVS